MINNEYLDCFDCSNVYEDVSYNDKKIQWCVDLLYNGKIVGIIKANSKKEALKLRKRWHNGDELPLN